MHEWQHSSQDKFLTWEDTIYAYLEHITPASGPPDEEDDAWGMFLKNFIFFQDIKFVAFKLLKNIFIIYHQSLKTSRIFPVSSPNTNFVITEIEKRL